ncbi:MAG: PfkB family carbohydrate kinase [Sulfolobales archaeon]|nr:PfkB family carbohydrate kinase [Sulfolobales archaeon]MCX8198924.1 PfkB family carbohydrate kinase [Sulfolobales archaeon]MDW8169902.1 PfkB family carbohydrate kinase [Desulfurococcaceae archaeon]
MKEVKYAQVAVGNINVDIYLYLSKYPSSGDSTIANEAILSPGGSALNYATAVAIYGHVSHLVGVTSASPFMDYVLSEVVDKGVDVTYVRRIDGLPGLVIALVVDGKAENTLIRYRGVNTFLTPNDVPKDLLSSVSLIHIAGADPNVSLEILRRSLSLGVLSTYDPGVGLMINREKVVEAVKSSNIVFLNRREALDLTKGDPQKLIDMGIEVVVIKKGAAGAYAITSSEVFYAIAKPIHRVINTTGAGDALAAFFNSVFLESKDVGKALQYGVAAASLKTSCTWSIICFNKSALNRQLRESMVEHLHEPPSWVLED